MQSFFLSLSLLLPWKNFLSSWYGCYLS
jgi:hypothetical protein